MLILFRIENVIIGECTKVEALFNNAKCDWVVHNEWQNVHTTKHVFNLFSKDSKQENLNLTDLSYEIMRLFHSSTEAV